VAYLPGAVAVDLYTFSPEDFDIGKSFTLKLAGGGEKGVSKGMDALAQK
jgi:hypothetical protein